MSRLFVTIIALALSVSFAGAAFGKAAWKKDLGAKGCADCHLEDKKAKNPDNKHWKVAKDHAAKLKAAKGDYAGKKTCGDCHKGKMKP